MALSENEQRLLEQMEAALAAEDPKLADALRGTSRTVRRRRAALSGLGFLLGLAALVGGMELHPVLSILGFVVMLGSAVVGIAAWQRPGGDQPQAPAGSDFRSRLEERWRRDQDGTS